MNLAEFFLLAILSIFWPLLLAVVVVALRRENMVSLLCAFLAGGLLTCITIGIAIVFFASESSLTTSSRGTTDPAVYISAGVLSLVAAWLLRARGSRPPKPKKQKTGRFQPESMLGSARLAFVGGIVLNIVPGVVPFVALKNIAELDAADATKVLLVVVFYVIMFAVVEVPIVAHLVAPERTAAAVTSIDSWLSRNGRRLGEWTLAAAGVYLVVRGLLLL